MATTGDSDDAITVPRLRRVIKVHQAYESLVSIHKCTRTHADAFLPLNDTSDARYYMIFIFSKAYKKQDVQALWLV